MKKILMVTLEFPPMVGGIATYVDDFVHALPPENVIVLAPPTKLLARWFWPRWLLLAWRVFLIIKKEKIEVVIIHHILPVGYAALIARWLTRVPYIIFSHGTDIAAASRHAWKRLMVRLICNSAEQIVMNSESLKRRFLIKFNDYESKTKVIYPCPNDIFFKPVSQEKIREIKSHLAIGGRQVILSVARMIDGKGFPHLVRVIKDVADQVPNITWLIIGTGPKLAEIIDLVQKNSLQNIVRFIGEIPHSELPAYFQASNVFTLLTHPDNGMEEGLGLVFLEAAGSGLPCIAGKSGGVEEAVVHGQTGYVFDVYQNQKAITEALVSLLKDPSLATRLGQHGQARIRSEFNWKNQLYDIMNP
ncbi:MAG: hypothetical protein A2821_03240 [Candidatus Magasanikbacteria bacterium RIFCSPHIGHO2_01_FULL_41_23]|uniref:Glycosyl transferase family 1 domain-containing protein n=1 Tax=Candidatus Magasanikbacteria bacterium RIFCSPLOWO2_01_FULL_40_15 TaxID=1798686 RepID=A0A1F6N1T2_9BACT|nr:MAG: hypothetical protein A2821_03240 [Candidatus Magasanikbacteria bacterium RIFCSPHIGHO2_01_FULL_41_23]OGH76470.1 MAG: hypothetical protein A3F22_03230 [Candidatus Magasanikbacteria bacterium RIFCSPHIGHO2_12_FULL_41_16]OGH77956.1 MAG: hypothetical protein A2983_01265 [Candidatus Magasanikbacteria bacterium RIFCSPLOWO2_01_FULL_40_15]